jgi:exonuclease SbcC
MKINTITCDNFFSHTHTVINLNDMNEPVLLTGENGAGKSSAVSEALTYVLFGETRLSSIDDAIRQDSQEMSVTIEFELNGQSIEIARSKKRGKSQKLSLIIDGTDVSELLSETQVRINKLLGNLSYDAFISSVILKQNDADYFVNQDADQRKKIIAEILDLNVYEKLEKLARDMRQQTKAEIKADQNLLSGLDEENIESLESDIKTINTALNKLTKQITAQEQTVAEIAAANQIYLEQAKLVKEIELHNTNITKSIAKNEITLTQQRATLKTCQEFLASFKDVSSILKNAEQAIKDLKIDIEAKNIVIKELTGQHVNLMASKVEALNEKLSVLNSTIGINQNIISDIDNKITKLQNIKDANCPMCLRTLNKSEKTTMLQELSEEKTKLEPTLKKDIEEKTKLELLKKQLRNDSYTDKELIALTKMISNETAEQQVLQINLDKAEQIYKTKLNHQQEFKVNEERQKNLIDNIATLETSNKDLNNQIKSIQPITATLQDDSVPRTKLMELRTNHSTALKTIATLEERINNGKKNNERKTQLITRINESIAALALLEKLCIAFSRKGIPAIIIATVLPEIEETTNEYLSRISDDNLSIQFVTTETLKNGEEKETLNINVFDGNVWRCFESYSGGEKFRVSLSIRLALSRILARRAGIELETLILDEPASPLDGPGLEVFCTTIKSLSSYFPRIVLISHLQNLNSEFENRIHLTKGHDGTQVAA